MAVPKKGWRKIVVEEKQYFWRAIGTDHGITAVIITDNAFVSGKSSQQLVFNLDYDHKTVQSNEEKHTKQQAIISPSVIRMAIELALQKVPPFTGEFGLEHIVLKGEDVSMLQNKACLSA